MCPNYSGIFYANQMTNLYARKLEFFGSDAVMVTNKTGICEDCFN